MSAGDFYENQYLDSGLGNDHSSRFPDTVYLLLATGAIADDGTGGPELDGAVSLGYERPAITNNSTNFPDAVSSQKKNGAVITFPNVATADWEEATHWALVNHVTNAMDATNVIHKGALSIPWSILNGQTAKVPVNALVITCD